MYAALRLTFIHFWVLRLQVCFISQPTAYHNVKERLLPFGNVFKYKYADLEKDFQTRAIHPHMNEGDFSPAMLKRCLIRSVFVLFPHQKQKQTAMTQNEKQLLLLDLCGRIPYGVIVKISHRVVDGNVVLKEDCHDEKLSLWNTDLRDKAMSNIKPYLRSMSSMTDEEKKKYKTLLSERKLYGSLGIKIIDWLNENHFDYRSLIPMGLAIEAPQDMYC